MWERLKKWFLESFGPIDIKAIEQKTNIQYQEDEPEPEVEEEDIVPNAVTENRIKILRVNPQLLLEMLIRGRKIAYSVITNGLPEDAICLIGPDDGGYDENGFLCFTIASKEWPPFTYEPVNGIINPPESINVPMLKPLQLGYEEEFRIKKLVAEGKAEEVINMVNEFIKPPVRTHSNEHTENK